jgi:hypothetical protein
MISEARTKRISEGVARDEGVDAESWLHGQERLTYGMGLVEVARRGQVHGEEAQVRGPSWVLLPRLSSPLDSLLVLVGDVEGEAQDGVGEEDVEVEGRQQ